MTAWRVLLLNTKLHNLNGYLTTFVRDAFEELLGDDRVVVSDYHSCLEDLKRHRCNVVVCLDGQELHRKMVARLREHAPRMVLWLTEDPYEQGTNRRNFDLFDIVFSNDRGSVRAYASPKVHHLPLAASEPYHFREVVESERDFLYDVFFAGVAWPNRVDLLRRITDQLRGLRWKFILPHNEFLPKPDLGVPDFELDYRLSNPDLATVQNRSKIVLYLHRVFSASGVDQPSTTPGPRIFETALSGAFQLVEDTLPETSDYFERDRELSYFRTLEDCVSLIRHFLEHPERRVRIARAAQNRARADHLYRHRVRDLLKRLEDVEPRPELRIETQTPRSVLYVVHNASESPPFGGTELHTIDTIERLSPSFRGYLYYPDSRSADRTKMILRRGTERKTFALSNPLSPYAYFDIEREHLFARLLEQYRIDIVHFMHFMHHPMSLVDVARRHHAATIVTLHDYFAVCPRFNLLDAGGKFCWTTRPPMESCDIDLRRTDNLASGSQASRRAFVAYVLSRANAITCVSESQKSLIASAYPHIADAIQVISPGIEPKRFAMSPPRPPRAGRPLVCAAVGNFTYPKGGDALIHVFNHCRDTRQLSFIVMGRLDAPYPEIMDTVGLDHVEVVGSYDPNDLPGLLARVDVALLASIWPESYVLTLSECWAAGIVPIVSDIGALAERVTDEVNGLKVAPDSPGAIAEALSRLVHEPGLLERLRAGGAEARFATHDGATRAYEALYNSLISDQPVYALRPQQEPFDFEPIDCGNRRLNGAWGRADSDDAGRVNFVQMSSRARRLSLPRKIMSYYGRNGFKQTMRRAVARLRGMP